MTYELSQPDLEALEADVAKALKSRDNSGLSVLGFGEVSIALGYPTDSPRVVCKRTPLFTGEEFEQYKGLVTRYVADLEVLGMSVVPTSVMAVPRGDRHVGYLVQPLMPSESIGHRILENSHPDPRHPFLRAVSERLRVASNRISIDAQVTNWSWDGTRPTLLDVGTPFVWDEQGKLEFDMVPHSKMGPAPIRPPLLRDMEKVISRWQTPRGVGVDVIANLLREGLDAWVGPAIEAVNEAIDTTEPPIEASEAHKIYQADKKTFPRLKKMQQVERAWQTRIRRRRYDFFVQESTYR